MAKNKHLSLEERIFIESSLKEHLSISMIARSLGKTISSISREIRLRSTTRQSGSKHHVYNACSKRFICVKSHICITCHASRKFKRCRDCIMCNAFCSDFSKEVCLRLSKPPYCCNGCSKWLDCSLEKRYYSAPAADEMYRRTLSEARTGISFSEDEVLALDSFVSPLIKQGQSPHHICITNFDTLMVSERTIYRYIDSRIISAMNIDLPRKVRFRARKKVRTFKVDKNCRIGRDFSCFLTFMQDNPLLPVVQLDSVEGIKGGKVLLTIHFVNCEFMLAFLRDANTSSSVTTIFNSIYLALGNELFKTIFKVCLADNGSEFSNPCAIEFDNDGSRRTFLFYCDPSSPYQKGSAERNHEFIRAFFPKGSSFNAFSQDDISLMMDHINSYHRDSIGGRSPYEMFSFMYGKQALDLLECHPIPPQEVTLSKSIFNKGVIS